MMRPEAKEKIIEKRGAGKNELMDPELLIAMLLAHAYTPESQKPVVDKALALIIGSKSRGQNNFKDHDGLNWDMKEEVLIGLQRLPEDNPLRECLSTLLNHQKIDIGYFEGYLRQTVGRQEKNERKGGEGKNGH